MIKPLLLRTSSSEAMSRPDFRLVSYVQRAMQLKWIFIQSRSGYPEVNSARHLDPVVARSFNDQPEAAQFRRV